MSQLTVRLPKPDDLAPLVTMFNHYIKETNVAFSERTYETEERREWFNSYKESGPYRLFVAERDGQVLGCAYSGRYKEHPAFRESIETSVYLIPEARGQRVGSALYKTLFSALSGEKLHRALVGIALPNPASIALHERFGFRVVGVFDEYAIKNGNRVSSICMEKALDGAWDSVKAPPEFLSVKNGVRPAFIKHYSEIRQNHSDAHYSGSDELLSIGSPLGSATGLTKIGIHHEELPPGHRTSWPHAESDEEEFVYVIEGNADVWIDGEIYPLVAGDAVGFPAGTGIAHVFINNSSAPVRLLVVGEATKKWNRIFYPLNEARNRELGSRLWSDVPKRPLGAHDGLPDALRDRLRNGPGKER